MKVYLDLCCLKRPFDDQGEERVRLESEAVKLVLERIDTGGLKGCSSRALVDENALNPVAERRGRAGELIARLGPPAGISASTRQLALSWEREGFDGFDALHLACAIAARADFLLTCDDALLRRARRHEGRLGIRVENPVDFLRSTEGRRS